MVAITTGKKRNGNLLTAEENKMTKALRSYPEKERAEVAKRRIEKKSGGLGYLSAVDFFKHPKKEENMK